MKVRIVIAAVFGVAAFVTMATPATAADSKDWACVRVYGGEACFQQYGDNLRVRDTVSDGYRAVMEWVVNYPRDTPECVDSNGANNGWEYCWRSMKEGQTIAFKVEIRNGSVPIRSSDWVEMTI